MSLINDNDVPAMKLAVEGILYAADVPAAKQNDPAYLLETLNDIARYAHSLDNTLKAAIAKGVP